MPSSGGTQRFGARARASSTDTGSAAVAVIVQDQPTRKAKAEAQAGADLAKSALGGGASSVVLKQVSMPGADDAWTLDYDENPAGAAKLHSASVTADVGGRLVVIQARDAADAYDGSGLPSALATAEFTS